MAALTLPFVRPLNAMVIPIQSQGRRHYFFCDTGSPYSFSSHLHSIPANQSPTHRPFPLEASPFELEPLSDTLGLEISGFLGINYFSAAAYFGIDYCKREVCFNHVPYAKLFYDSISIPLHNGPVVMARFQGGEKLAAYVDTGSFLCFYFDDNPPKCLYRISDLRYPTAQGMGVFSMQTPCKIELDDQPMGEFTIGIGPRRGQLRGVIGNNFLSRFQVLFDWRNMFLRLLPRVTKRVAWEEPKPSMNGPGFQITAPPHLSPRRIHVSHRPKTTSINPAFQNGVSFELPGLDWTCPEVINDVMSRLSLAEDIPAMMNGHLLNIETRPLFKMGGGKR